MEKTKNQTLNLSAQSYLKDKLNKIYPDICDSILESIQYDSNIVFRFNPKRVSNEEIISILNSSENLRSNYRKGYFPNSYVLTIRDSKEFTKLEVISRLVDDGRIYIQNSSSMIPCYVLDPKESEKILDMCASPGGKTSLISLLSNDLSEIHAIENNRNRFFILKNNLNSQKITNVTLHLIDASIFSKIRPQYLSYFDKILLDAPCSNESGLRGDNLKRKINTKLPKKLSRLQKRLFASAYDLVKSGGIIVYSTCTYSIEENEEVVNWALKKFDLELVDISHLSILKDGYKDVFRKGLELFSIKDSNSSSDISNTLRVIPNNEFNAFYVALLRKK